MNSPKFPHTDSIQELAEFWDTHDVTDFEDQLEEVTDQIFERTAVLNVSLRPSEAESVNKLAKSKGLNSDELIREWILERIDIN